MRFYLPPHNVGNGAHIGEALGQMMVDKPPPKEVPTLMGLLGEGGPQDEKLPPPNPHHFPPIQLDGIAARGIRHRPIGQSCRDSGFFFPNSQSYL